VSVAIAALAAAALAIAALVFVAWPLLSPDRGEPDVGLTETERRKLAAAERRDETYAALNDLELDERSGKITPPDAEAERVRLRAEAAAALAELDALELADTQVAEEG
jgi:hypothetical protein